MIWPGYVSITRGVQFIKPRPFLEIAMTKYLERLKPKYKPWQEMSAILRCHLYVWAACFTLLSISYLIEGML